MLIDGVLKWWHNHLARRPTLAHLRTCGHFVRVSSTGVVISAHHIILAPRNYAHIRGICRMRRQLRRNSENGGDINAPAL